MKCPLIHKVRRNVEGTKILEDTLCLKASDKNNSFRESYILWFSIMENCWMEIENSYERSIILLCELYIGTGMYDINHIWNDTCYKYRTQCFILWSLVELCWFCKGEAYYGERWWGFVCRWEVLQRVQTSCDFAYLNHNLLSLTHSANVWIVWKHLSCKSPSWPIWLGAFIFCYNTGSKHDSWSL